MGWRCGRWTSKAAQIARECLVPNAIWRQGVRVPVRCRSDASLRSRHASSDRTLSRERRSRRHESRRHELLNRSVVRTEQELTGYTFRCWRFSVAEMRWDNYYRGVASLFTWWQQKPARIVFVSPAPKNDAEAMALDWGNVGVDLCGAMHSALDKLPEDDRSSISNKLRQECQSILWGTVADCWRSSRGHAATDTERDRPAVPRRCCWINDNECGSQGAFGSAPITGYVGPLQRDRSGVAGLHHGSGES